VSNGGVLVASQQLFSQNEIRVGAWVDMSLEWPSQLDGKLPLHCEPLAPSFVAERPISLHRLSDINF
jgi:hypothetical protein